MPEHGKETRDFYVSSLEQENGIFRDENKQLQDEYERFKETLEAIKKVLLKEGSE